MMIQNKDDGWKMENLKNFRRNWKFFDNDKVQKKLVHVLKTIGKNQGARRGEKDRDLDFAR